MIHYYGWNKGSRHVVVIGPLTFKFPKLWLNRLWHIVRRDSVKDWWFWYKSYLGVSFGENFTEAKWFFKKKPPQIVPCMLPLVIINAYLTQKGVGALKVEECIGGKYDPNESVRVRFSREFWRAFSDKGASHTFGRNENYALHNGKARLLDYGAPGVMELVVNHQEEFSRFLKVVKDYSGVC